MSLHVPMFFYSWFRWASKEGTQHDDHREKCDDDDIVGCCRRAISLRQNIDEESACVISSYLQDAATFEKLRKATAAKLQELEKQRLESAALSSSSYSCTSASSSSTCSVSLPSTSSSGYSSVPATGASSSYGEAQHEHVKSRKNPDNELGDSVCDDESWLQNQNFFSRIVPFLTLDIHLEYSENSEDTTEADDFIFDRTEEAESIGLMECFEDNGASPVLQEKQRQSFDYSLVPAMDQSPLPQPSSPSHNKSLASVGSGLSLPPLSPVSLVNLQEQEKSSSDKHDMNDPYMSPIASTNLIIPRGSVPSQIAFCVPELDGSNCRTQADACCENIGSVPLGTGIPTCDSSPAPDSFVLDEGTSLAIDEKRCCREPLPYSDTKDCCASVDDDEHRRFLMILDPTEPLIHSVNMDNDNDYLQIASSQLSSLLNLHESKSQSIKEFQCQEVIQIVEEHPAVCQVQFPVSHLNLLYDGDETGDDKQCCCLYPLAYFAATNCLHAVKVVYDAFPEAVGHDNGATTSRHTLLGRQGGSRDSSMADSCCLGTPLHYACASGAGHEIIKFLIERYPEAVKRKNLQHQTPLHLACRQQNSTRLGTVRLLLQHYPTAAQLGDSQGFTPLHWAIKACFCERLSSAGDGYAPLEWEQDHLAVLNLLLDQSPSVIRTRTKDWRTAMHIAASMASKRSVAACDAYCLKVLHLLHRHDPTAVRATDDSFSTPLHAACEHGLPSLAVVQFLVDAFPSVLKWTNEEQETPLQLARRFVGVSISHGNYDRSKIVELLKPQEEQRASTI